MLFGRRHPAGWVAGSLVGYALSALAIWIPIRVGAPSAFAFVASWLTLTAAIWVLARKRSEPLIPLDPWRKEDTVAYAVVLAVTIAVAAPPLVAVGRYDRQGNRYYRAYFTADFVWHTALTAEIGKFSMPPRNPFLRNRPIHYYWAYFLVPVAVSTTGPPVLRDVERCLKLNAFFNGLLLMSALFMSVRAATPATPGRTGSIAVGISVTLALVASSAEAWDAWRTTDRLADFRNLNIDAMTAWQWNGYRIDGLQRAIWYNPQHSMSGALGLVAMTAAAAAGSAPSALAGLLTGLVLAGSIMVNPFVGGLFALTYGFAAAVDVTARRRDIRRLLFSSLAALPAVAAVGWCIGNRMVEGAGGALEFGFHGLSRNAPLITLFLSLGPALLPAIAGLFIRGAPAFHSFVPAMFLATVSLFLMYFVRLSVDVYWVGFRTGHLMLFSLPALCARFFTRALQASQKWAMTSLAIILLLGAPTLAIDAYNARDTSNFAISPGDFPWTRVVNPDYQAAFRWLREKTPESAVIQQDPLSRGRTTWWVVPTFGQRRMAAGLPPFMLDVPEYHEKSETVRRIYATTDAEEAWSISHGLRIDYIYIDEVERAAYSGGLQKFSDVRYFEQAFRNREVMIYRVR
jgi:hypothetical protein